MPLPLDSRRVRTAAPFGAMVLSSVVLSFSLVSGQTSAPDAVTRVIVQFGDADSLQQQAVLARHSMRSRRNLSVIHSVAMEVSAREIQSLESEPGVVSVVPDQQVHATASNFTTPVDYGWMTVLGVANNSTPFAYTGRGIGVAV